VECAAINGRTELALAGDYVANVGLAQVGIRAIIVIGTLKALKRFVAKRAGWVRAWICTIDTTPKSLIASLFAVAEQPVVTRGIVGQHGDTLMLHAGTTAL
jgi:hypothetical protein